MSFLAEIPNGLMTGFFALLTTLAVVAGPIYSAFKVEKIKQVVNTSQLAHELTASTMARQDAEILLLRSRMDESEKRHSAMTARALRFYIAFVKTRALAEEARSLANTPAAGWPDLPPLESFESPGA